MSVKQRLLSNGLSYNGPVYVRLGRAGVDDVTTEGYSFVPGKSTILVDGSDVTIILVVH